uniref:THO complex subunit 1 n=1 Tax=Panagrellus redivivus TaxID=6233 RepID=A0A7E4V766_PANRE
MEVAVRNLDLEGVKSQCEDPSSDEARELNHSTIENAVRTVAFEMSERSAPVTDFEPFFMFIVELAKNELCAKSLTIAVISDVLETIQKSQLSGLFAIIENNIDVWKSPEFFDACKNSILRMCNDLLKRLSKTIDTQFCGRVNILLSRSLPLNERSGLNLTSQFNSNDTDFDQVELIPDEKDEDEKMEDNEIDATPEIPVDFDLYQRFWGLQKYFSDPNVVYSKQSFEEFQTNLNKVLGVFTTYRLDRRRGASSKPTAMEVEELGQPDVFYAKYQTSQKLLHLQFADPQFRRFFFVQCLITTNYLQSDVKFRDHSLTLTDDQSKYINEVNDKCYKLLKDTFPRGWHFSEFVKKIISREKVWSTWKNEGCPDWLSTSAQNNRPPVKSFKRAPPPMFYDDGDTIDLGTENLNRLWNAGERGNLAAAMNAKRNYVPKPLDLLNEALDHADPEQGVEPEYSCFRNESFQWRATRLFLDTSEYFMTVQSTPAGKKPSPAYPELLQRALLNVAINDSDEEVRARGAEVSVRAEAHAVKLEAEAKAAQEAAQQRAEEEAKAKALEAAAERKRKDEELAAQRAKELAEIQSRKARTSDTKDPSSKNVEDGEVTEESPPSKTTNSTNGTEAATRTKSPAAPRRKGASVKTENGHDAAATPTDSDGAKKRAADDNDSVSPAPSKRSRRDNASRNEDDRRSERSERNGSGRSEAAAKEKVSKRAKNEINFPSSVTVNDGFISDVSNALADRSRDVCSVLQYSDHKDDRHRNSASVVKAALRQWASRDPASSNLRTLGGLLNDIQCVDDVVMNIFRKEVDAHTSNSKPSTSSSSSTRGSSRSRYHRKDR